MARNNRSIRDWTPERVDATPVAPHRYSWDDDSWTLNTYKAVKDAAPYKPGDVVYVVYGEGYIRARVLHVFVRRNHNEDYVEYYRVQLETKAGYWSKLWIESHPGLIQRGYQRAGLAPEMPKEE